MLTSPKVWLCRKEGNQENMKLEYYTNEDGII
jgi:hypothetical protein